VTYIPLRIAPDDPGIREEAKALILALVDKFGTERAVGLLVQALNSCCVGLVEIGDDCADMNLQLMLGLLEDLKNNVIRETAETCSKAVEPVG